MSTTKQNLASQFDLEEFLGVIGKDHGKLLTIEFPGYPVLKFRLLYTFDEKQNYTHRMNEFCEKIKDQKRLPAAWKELGKFSEGEAAAAFAISELSHEPKIDQLTALKLLKRNGAVSSFIVQQIAEASRIKAEINLAEKVEAEKKD